MKGEMIVVKRIISSIFTGILTGSAVLNLAVVIMAVSGQTTGLTLLFSDYLRELLLCCIIGTGVSMSDITISEKRVFFLSVAVYFSRGVLTFFICSFVFGWIPATLINISIFAAISALIVFAFAGLHLLRKVISKKLNDKVEIIV